jgi:hypothetical protein
MRRFILHFSILLILFSPFFSEGANNSPGIFSTYQQSTPTEAFDSIIKAAENKDISFLTNNASISWQAFQLIDQNTILNECSGQDGMHLIETLPTISGVGEVDHDEYVKSVIDFILNETDMLNEFKGIEADFSYINIGENCLILMADFRPKNSEKGISFLKIDNKWFLWIVYGWNN